MTLIACFNQALVENISLCLRLKPDKLILLGSPAEMSAPTKRYSAILQRRGLRTKVQLCDIQGKHTPQISAVLRDLVRKEPDCKMKMFVFAIVLLRFPLIPSIVH